MKIAIFSDNFYPELSGVADSLSQSAAALAKLGHQLAIFAPKYSKDNYRTAHRPWAEINLGENVNIFRFGSLPFPSSNRQARLVAPSAWRWLKVKKFKPDIIHSQLFFGVGLEGLLAARILKRPIIGTNHTRLNEFLKASFPRSDWLIRWLTGYMYWYYNHCDYVTAPSQSFLNEMFKYGLNRPAQAISNPIDAQIFNNLNKTVGAAVRKKYNLPERVIVYAGRLAAEKNIEVIVRSIRLVKEKFPEINLALAGHGQARQSLEKLARELDIENNVKFLGTLSHHGLAELYRAADAFAMASTSEVQSMTIIQAMACGLPVVGVNYNSIPELVREDNGLLFKVGDHQDLADKLISLLSDHALRQKLSRGAANFAAKFSAENIAKEWEELYQKVINDYNQQ